MKIGFFDSGIGGMTVLQKALKLMPNEDYVYYADTVHVPYGEKTTSEVRKYVFAAAKFLASKEISALVIACNTATSAVAEDLRRQYSFPVIGIEPAVKPAISKSRLNGKRVLVLATKLTLQEKKYNHLVAELDEEHIVDGLPLPGLVKFAEKFEFNSAVVTPYLQEQFASYDLTQYQTVVLGCTHFPLYKDMLQQILPATTDIIDGSSGTAKNLQRILAAAPVPLNRGTGRIEYYCSGEEINEPEILAKYNGLLQRLEQIV